MTPFRHLVIYLSAAVLSLAGCASTPEAPAPSEEEQLEYEQPEMIETPSGGPINLMQGPLEVMITPDIGGRIASMRYRGEELLIDPSSTEDMMWGNVLWPSPQSNWGWPPLSVLDEEPYQVQRDGDTWELTSFVEPSTGFEFVKRYRMEAEPLALVIDYQIYNRGDRDHLVAHWEVTRVPPSGLVFFPTGKTNFISGVFSPLPVRNVERITWYEYRPELLNGGHKLMTDGSEGWLAHINNDLAFIKQFPDVPAPLNVRGEGEIEIYTNPEKTLIEVEQQGPITRLAPGESLSWQVRWLVRPVPKNLTVEVGNVELADWVRAQVREVAQ